MAIVKYHNELNKVVLSHLDEKETDIFYTIIYKMKEKTEAVFLPEEIKKFVVEEGNRSSKRFFESLNNVFKTQLRIYEDSSIADYHLFITKKYDEKTGNIFIKIHPDVHYVLNGLIKNYTSFELKEFINLKGEYPKKLFRLIMQFKDTGKVIFEKQKFISLLEIPVNYKECNIDQKVFKICLRELSSIFFNLKIKKLKIGKNKQSVSHYQFTWKNNPKEAEIIEEVAEDENIIKLFNLCKIKTEEIKKFIAENIEKYSFEILETNIKYSNKYAKENYFVYLKKALAGDWAKSMREQEEAKKQKKKQNEFKPAELEEKTDLENLSEAEKHYLKRAKLLVEGQK